MLWLSWDLMEHKLLFKEGFWPHKQAPKCYTLDILVKAKGEIERLLKANFIMTSRYVKWIVSIVPIIKKNKQSKFFFFFNLKNLNDVTPKDENPTPIINVLIDLALGHILVSFIDGMFWCIGNLWVGGDAF